MVGAVTGNPGTMPNNWGARALVSGVTSSIDGLGVENGINYIDVRFTGTPSSLAQIYFALGPAITASSGQVWTASILSPSFIAGSMTNTQTLGIQLNEIPNNTLDRASVVPTTAPLNTQRSGVTATLQATTTSIIPYFVFQGTSTSLAFDFTIIRVGAPQVELGAYRPHSSRPVEQRSPEPAIQRICCVIPHGASMPVPVHSALNMIPPIPAPDCKSKVASMPSAAPITYYIFIIVTLPYLSTESAVSRLHRAPRHSRA